MIVELEGDSILLLGPRARVMTRVPFAVLDAHGHATNRFSMGRDFDPVRGVGRLVTVSTPALAHTLLTLPVVAGVAGLLLRRRTLAPRPHRRGRPVAALAGVGAGLALALGFEAVVRLLGLEVAEQPIVEALVAAGAVPFALLAVVAVVVAPLGEELFFRGWVFGYLETRVGRAVAYGGSAALFAVAHLHPPALAAYFVLGLAFAGLYAWSGSLWTSVLAHATANLVAVAGQLV